VLQGPSKHLAHSAEGPAFRLRPDAVVVSTTDSIERLFDAKWKRLDPGAVGRGVAREDAYQLATYAGAYRCPSVALVYPRARGLPAGLVEAIGPFVRAGPAMSSLGRHTNARPGGSGRGRGVVDSNAGLSFSTLEPYAAAQLSPVRRIEWSELRPYWHGYAASLPTRLSLTSSSFTRDRQPAS
jgi:hypothetical protein